MVGKLHQPVEATNPSDLSTSVSSAEIEEIVRLHFREPSTGHLDVSVADVADSLGISADRVAGLLSKIRAEQTAQHAFKQEKKRFWLWSIPIIAFSIASFALLRLMVFPIFEAQDRLSTNSTSEIASVEQGGPVYSAGPDVEQEDLQIVLPLAKPEYGLDLSARTTLASAIGSEVRNRPGLMKEYHAQLTPIHRVDTTSEQEESVLRALNSEKNFGNLLRWLDIKESQYVKDGSKSMTYSRGKVPVYYGKDIRTNQMVQSEQDRRLALLLSLGKKTLDQMSTQP